MKCPNCKAEVSAGRSICPFCGHFFNDNTQPGLAAGKNGGETSAARGSGLGKILAVAAAVVVLLFAGIGVGSLMGGRDSADSAPTPTQQMTAAPTPTPTTASTPKPTPAATPAPTKKPKSVYLAELAPVKTGPSEVVYYVHKDVQDAEKNTYKYGITMDFGKAAEMFAQFDLKGKYTEFSFYYGTNRSCGETNLSNTKNVILVFYYADGTMHTEELDERRFDTPTRYFEFDITGVEKLEICYPATKGYNDLAELFDAKLS